MNLIPKLYKDAQDNVDKLNNNLSIRNKNNELVNNANTISALLSTTQDISTEFEYMDIFVQNDKVTVLYKQWEVLLFSTENIENELVFLLASIQYEIIFEESADLNIKYYNTDTDIQLSKFYEVKDNTLILKPSLYIKKTFDGAELSSPKVQLRIILKSPINVVK